MDNFYYKLVGGTLAMLIAALTADMLVTRWINNYNAERPYSRPTFRPPLQNFKSDDVDFIEKAIAEL